MRVEPYVIDKGRGRAVVLLHAYPLNASMWLAQRESLGQSYRVLTPDLRGFGGTQLGSDEPSLDEMADDVAAMLDSKKIDTCVLGGLSMGGYVAMAFLRRHGDRASALVLADTKASADTAEAAANRRAIAERVMSEEGTGFLVDDLLPKLVGKTTFERRALILGRVRAMVESAPAYAVAWAQRAMADRPDSFDVLRGYDRPALVIVGEEDELSPPPEAEAMADALPNATLATIPKSGHLSAVETPEEFNASLLEFLGAL